VHVIVGNAKGPIHNKSQYTAITKNILRVPPHVRPISYGQNTYGNSSIEESLPRGTDSCPFIFSLPTKHNLKTNSEDLIPEIQSLGVDIIFGIDMGGDSISGGIDHPGDAALGRDMQFKVICKGTGIPFYHIVAAPCCDGETTFEQMEKELATSQVLGTMLGCFSMDFMKECFATYTCNLTPDRTPNIVLQALNNQLEVVQGQPNPIFVKIPRLMNPVVPLDWVTRAWVLKYNLSNL